MRSFYRSLTVAATLAALAGAHAFTQETERCYGVAPTGANDGIGDDAGPGTSTVDYQGDAWANVPRGACLTTPLPPQPDGTPRRGSFEPLARDPAG